MGTTRDIPLDFSTETLLGSSTGIPHGPYADVVLGSSADTPLGSSIEIPLGSSVLVSACLLGEPCRYDGASKPCPAVQELKASFRLVCMCPEQLGGLPTPRTPCELQPDGRVLDARGADRTDNFSAGAQACVQIARQNSCKTAVLKAKSPSCGVHEIYDGSFTGKLVPGEGVAAKALREAGVIVFDETDLS